MGTMDGFLKRIVMSIVGVVLVLGFWTIQGKCNGSKAAPVVAKIPAKVWEGGGGKCKLEVEVSDPSTVHLDFYQWSEKGPHKNENFPCQEAVGPGKHTFIVEVPPETNVS